MTIDVVYVYNYIYTHISLYTTDVINLNVITTRTKANHSS